MLVIPFDSPAATLNNAGGKGLNLVRLTRTGFPVPPGFILATEAYRTYVEANQLREVIRSAVEGLSADDPTELDQASTRIRTSFSDGQLPSLISEPLLAAYTQLGEVPVAVRSSATTEDLPDLSFAGQQDTFLNIINPRALQRAVVDSWSSLWTARAIGYRVRNAIDHAQTALAVVVQELVASDVSGVLFTANPLTGRLNEMVVNATHGLGEALVAGQVEPDTIVIDSLTGEVIDYEIGEKKIATQLREGGGVLTIQGESTKEASLTQGQLDRLHDLGVAVQAEYCTPQDLEWAIAKDDLYLLQSRPITALFPVPEISFDPLIVWLSFGSVQGVVGPITPLGRDILQRLIAGAGRLFLLDLDPETATIFETAGERLWARITGMLHHPLGKRIVGPILRFIEPSVGRILSELIEEPAVGAGKGKLRMSSLARLLYFFFLVVPRFIRNLISPRDVLHNLETRIDEEIAGFSIIQDGTAQKRLKAVTQTIRTEFPNLFPFILPRFVPMIGPGMGALNLLNHLAGERRGLPLEITRALPGNVTTEMDLALWGTARTIRQDPESAEHVGSTDVDALSRAYQSGELPPVAQQAIESFMDRYGMRGVGEIDLGQPRWREQPEPILHSLQSYLKIDLKESPDAQFARGERAAEEAIESLAEWVRGQPLGWIKARIVRMAARRIRLLAGSRESPKFFIIRVMGITREALLSVGQALVEAGSIAEADDLTYLTVCELEALADGSEQDWKEIVSARRKVYAFEARRKQVPRVLVSDGRAYYEGIGAGTDTDEVVMGSPVSPGFVEGIVRVVLDARGAQLNPGEILVCPGTDPAWTPLLMAASGLIMEVGGLMTHGSVVAREFGIPAVVGVHRATERFHDGQRVRINGSTGEIEVMPK